MELGERQALKPFIPMAPIIPEGENNEAAVEHFVVGEKEAMFASLRPRSMIYPGTYCRLRVGRTLMMTDVRFEQLTNHEVVHRSNGDVFIAGLGIGMVLVPVALKDEVKSITIIEKYQGVVDLVMPSLKKKIGKAAAKVEVIVADALEWKPPRGRTWDTIYFDIWPDVCVDNLEEVAKLKRRFARRLRRHDNPKAWMGAWEEDTLRREKRRNRENSHWYW